MLCGSFLKSEQQYSHQKMDEKKITFADKLNIDPSTYRDLVIDFDRLRVRTSNCLHNAGILTTSKLLEMSEDDLRKIRGFGTSSLVDILNYLKSVTAIKKREQSFADIDITPFLRHNKSMIFEGRFNPVIMEGKFSDRDVNCLAQFKKIYEILDIKLVEACDEAPEYVASIIKAFQGYSQTVAVRGEIEAIMAPVSWKKKNLAQPYIESFFQKDKGQLEENVFSCEEGETLGDYLTRDTWTLDELKSLLNVARFAAFDLKCEFEKFLERASKGNDRTMLILESRAGKKTLEEVGTKIGLTRERVRQIEQKVVRPFCVWQKDVSFLPRLVADFNGNTIIEDLELRDFFGEMANVLIYLLKFADDETFSYDRQTDTLIIQSDNITEGVSLYVSNLPERIHDDEYEQIMCRAQDDGLDINLFEREFTVQYKKSGNYYHRTRLTLVHMYEDVLKKYYPDGMDVYDEDEVTRFKQYIRDEYGDVKLPNNTRAVSAAITRVSVLCGRGRYRIKKDEYIPSSLLKRIHDYIANSDRPLLLINTLFAVFEDELKSYGIDNRYYLQGILKEAYGDEFFFKKDYISKDGQNYSFYNEVVLFIKKSEYPVTRDQIKAEFPGISEIMISFGVSDEKVLNFFGSYVYADNLKLFDEDIRYIEDTVNKLLPRDLPCHVQNVYDAMEQENPDLLRRLGVFFQSSLFSVLNYLLGNTYKFERPYIARKGVAFDKPYEIIEEYLSEHERLDVDSLFELVNSVDIEVPDKLKYLNSLNDSHLLISKEEMASIEYIGIDEEKAKAIEGILLNEIKGTVQIASMKSIYSLPDLNVNWNEWLVYSIIYKYSDKLEVRASNSQFRFAEPVICIKGCFDEESLSEVVSGEAMVQVDDLDDIDSLIEDVVFEDL